MVNVVITGAGGVLCSAFAKDLAMKNGYNVALLSNTNYDVACEVAKDICAGGGNAKAYKADVLNRANIEEVHEEILKDFGKCTILINGVGGNSPQCTTQHEEFQPGDELETEFSTFFNLTEEGFDFVFDLNFKGTLLVTQVFAKDMIGQKGCSILNISSMNAFRPLTKIPAYSAAKSAIGNFTQWLAVHFAKQGIRVNALAPGFFVTNQNKALLFNEDGTPTARAGKIIAATPMGRFGEAEELLGAVSFLIDVNASAFITGITLPVDGGFSAYSGV